MYGTELETLLKDHGWEEYCPIIDQGYVGLKPPLGKFINWIFVPFLDGDFFGVYRGKDVFLERKTITVEDIYKVIGPKQRII